MPNDPIAALNRWLTELGTVKVAASGGVDSTTLALLAGRVLGERAQICHAVSPAVPAEATKRLQALAGQERWRLQLVNAGEFDNQDYLDNPYNRCFYCKTSLYSGLAVIEPKAATLLSGTNQDDLSDYRPGLKAAREHRVRHPFVECGIDKASIRRIAHHLGFDDLSELPASPCLSSRIETGLPIRADQLGFVHRVERRLQQTLNPSVVRCRIQANGIVIQLDPASLERLDGERAVWQQRILGMAVDQDLPDAIEFEPYRMGSAFVRPAD